jgi:hypothetical protein
MSFGIRTIISGQMTRTHPAFSQRPTWCQQRGKHAEKHVIDRSAAFNNRAIIGGAG